MKQSGVYAILNLKDQRAYIGRSCNIAQRWNEHRSDLRRGVHSAKALQDAWNTHGSTWFAFVVLESATAFDQCVALERFYLDSTIQPYNELITVLTGREPGYRHAPSSIAKMRAAKLGRPCSPETRQRMSDAKRGKPTGISPNKGRTFSDETKAKMRAAHLGLKGSPESRVKRSASLLGRVFTDEWKAKISTAKTGVSWSDARRARYKAKSSVSL